MSLLFSAASQVSLPSSSQMSHSLFLKMGSCITHAQLYKGVSNMKVTHPYSSSDKSPMPYNSFSFQKCPKSGFSLPCRPHLPFQALHTLLTHTPCNLGRRLDPQWFVVSNLASHLLPRLTTTTLRRCVGMGPRSGFIYTLEL